MDSKSTMIEEPADFTPMGAVCGVGGVARRDSISKFMLAALHQAELALECGEVPVGCVFVHNGSVISTGFNLTNELKNGTMHAEVVSINKITKEKKFPVSILRECDLYVTCEPCIMV